MRLINTSSLELKEFIGGDAPEYAILSHTWDEEEITLHELQHPTPQTHQKKGFKKVFRFCEIANQDGYTWVWCDTCCIDKTSSAELSEAINSMFTWYKCSHVCYAFLSDVRRNQSEKGTFGPNAWRQWEKSLNNSKWFRRGWTLQELIAPTVLRFYDADWTCIASKDAIAGAIADITEIDVGVFLHGFYPTNYTVATRMSWAAKRRTTRVEDIAYCLLGLFNVNMPLLYGEGTRAFRRLQEEILKHEEDLTLLAWTDKAIMGTVLPVLRDPLANSPSDFDPSANPDSEFQDYSQLVPLRDDTAPTKMHRRLVALAKTIDQPYAMTPKGIFLAVLISKKRVKRDPLLRSGFSILAFLNCFVRSSGKLVCLLLHGEYIDEAEALLKASVSTPSIRLVAPSSGFRPGKVYVSAPYGAEGNLMRLLPRAGRPPYALNLRPIFILQSNQRSIHSVNPGLFLPVLVEFKDKPIWPQVLEMKYDGVEFFIAYGVRIDMRPWCLARRKEPGEGHDDAAMKKYIKEWMWQDRTFNWKGRQGRSVNCISTQWLELKDGVFCLVEVAHRLKRWFLVHDIPLPSTKEELFTLDVSVPGRPEEPEFVRILPYDRSELDIARDDEIYWE